MLAVVVRGLLLRAALVKRMREERGDPMRRRRCHGLSQHDRRELATRKGAQRISVPRNQRRRVVSAERLP